MTRYETALSGESGESEVPATQMRRQVLAVVKILLSVTRVGTVLIIDDNDAIRRLVSKILDREGFRIEESPDGRDALEKLEHGDYDAVILDLMMPHATGFEVISALRMLRPDILRKVIIMTAAMSKLDSKDLEGVGAVVSKPFEIDNLVQTIRACINGSEEST
jgi:DNA-binding response OmpR family regulator